MQVSIDLKELAPVIAATVAEVLAQRANDENRLGDKLAFDEEEAARLMSLESHVLRDERRRGKIGASQIVNRRIRYLRSDLLDYMAANRIVAE